MYHWHCRWLDQQFQAVTPRTKIQMQTSSQFCKLLEMHQISCWFGKIAWNFIKMSNYTIFAGYMADNKKNANKSNLKIDRLDISEPYRQKFRKK
ncbi:hypothetical protein BpHYR1_043190 [Brachionus plicatilis]|uniref:Uncharacterized protein n=1 Tax=Brachionus plicatilis TaxID=10195 RepID=A0A3M7R987_BRAPC|nr:hypothetical protein BpHYR1_043190 [Brachionus plicatilis]